MKNELFSFKEKKLNLNNTVFLTSVYDLSTFPESLPQIAFAGKSNIGKSSAINKLLNRRSLARTSTVPGKTQCLNVYELDERLYFIDLPGYGYAKVSHEKRKSWGPLINSYFYGHYDIRFVILLMDIRHSPTEDDKEMLSYLIQAGYPFSVVFTKSDKLKKNAAKLQMDNNLNELNDYLNENFKKDSIPKFPVYSFSSENGDGVAELWAEIYKNLEESENIK